jgi:hypothetical protein
MTGNPEFRRNIWLEITPNRMIGMPLVLFALFFMAYVSDDNRLATLVTSTATGAFFVISLLWGTKLASESVMNEIRDHTWDGQRMSAISPWALSWGKLFGSTIYTWYGALICLAVAGLSATGENAGETMKSLLLFLLVGVLAQAVSLLASLMAIRKERKFNRSQTAAFLILGIVATSPFFGTAFDSKSLADWFGTHYERLDFVLGSLFCFTLWAIVGIYHLMRAELQMKNRPWVWYGFVLFLMGYVAGLFYSVPSVAAKPWGAASPPVLAAYFTAVAVTYFMAFAERKDFLSLHVLFRLASSGMWGRFLERSPRWILSFPIPVAAGIALMLFPRLTSAGAPAGIGWFVLASIFFMARDFGIMLFCNLGKSARRADMLTVLYLALLYGIVPSTLSAMGLETTTHLFWPGAGQYAYLGTAASLLELLAIAWMVAIRWKKRISDMDTPATSAVKA